jgi:hypothetical protein
MINILRKYLLILVLNCFFMVSHCQFYDINYFNNLYNQNTWSAGISIIEYNNSCFVSGIAGDSLLGYKNIVIVNVSLEGDLINWKEFRFNNSNHYDGLPGSLHNYNDTSFILCGSNNIGNESCGLFINFDSTFDNCKYYSYSSDIENFLLFQNCNIIDDSTIIFTGYERQLDQTGDVFLLKSKNNGTEYWRTHFGFETASEGQKVLLTSDSGLIISGYTYSPSNDYSGNALLIKTDNHGYMQWFSTPGNPDYRDGYGSVTIAPDGNYIFGYTHAIYQGPPYPVPGAYCKIKFIKYDQNGDTIWERMYGSSYQINMLRNIITLHDGSFLAVGYANSDTVSGPMQGWLFKINQYGDSIWYRDYRHYQESGILDYLYDVFETSDHSLIACGVSSRTEPGPDAVQRMWILKLDSAGCTEPGCDPTIGIGEQGSGEAGKQGGLEIWPNPASGIVDCRWPMVDFRGDCSLVIYDMYGRKMMNISVPEIEREIQFDVGNFIPGLYLVVIKDECNIIGSSKLIISR